MTKWIIYKMVLVCVIIFMSGCTAQLADPELDFKPPTYVEQMPAKEENENFVSTGSIFGQGSQPLFSDRKAMNVNDIVTVVISETATSSSSGAKNLSESDSTALGGGTFTSAGTNTAMNSYASKLTGITNTGFTSATENAFTGAGSASRDASFTTKVTGRVVKVLQNGNYFISGKKDILVDDQKQTIQISGVIRPYDIDQFNSVSSAQMSDAKILYKTEGDIDRATKQGWGTKIIQAVWPF